MRKKSISKEAIISSAMEIIRNKGLAGCSMRCISKDMGVAVGTIYNYYGSHDLLLKDVFKVSWQKTFDRIEAELEFVNDPKKKLEQYCRIVFEEIRNRQGIGEQLYGNLPMSLKDNHKHIEAFAKLIQAVMEILRDTPSNKHLDETDLEMVSRWVVLAILSYVDGSNSDYDTFTREIVSRFI